MRFFKLSLIAVLLGTGCAAQSTYRPAQVAAHELTLRYDDRFEVWTPDGKLTAGPQYAGLADYVACVPQAHQHAEAAQSWGTRSYTLAGFSIGLGVVGIGGLSGLAYLDKNEGKAAALLLGGVLVETAAIILGATSIGARSRAHGNAFDAINYYNDAVGASGAGCGPGAAGGP